MKKKSIATILTIALSVSMLAACGETGTTTVTPTNAITIITQPLAATPTATPVVDTPAVTAPIENQATVAPEPTKSADTQTPEPTKTAEVTTAPTSGAAVETPAPTVTPTNTPKPTNTPTPTPTRNPKDVTYDDEGNELYLVTPTPAPEYDAGVYYKFIWSELNVDTLYIGGCLPEYLKTGYPLNVNLRDDTEVGYLKSTVGITDSIIKDSSSISALYHKNSTKLFASCCIRPTKAASISSMCKTIQKELKNASFKNGKPSKYVILYNNSFIFVLLGETAYINEMVDGIAYFTDSAYNPDGLIKEYANGNM